MFGFNEELAVIVEAGVGIFDAVDKMGNGKVVVVGALVIGFYKNNIYNHNE